MQDITKLSFGEKKQHLANLLNTVCLGLLRVRARAGSGPRARLESENLKTQEW